MEHLIFTASELSTKRREVLDEARSSSGYAQIRDTDGTGLVLVSQRIFDLLRWIKEQFSKFVVLEAALERPIAQRKIEDLGEFAWMAVFDEEDQQLFRHELREAVLRSLASESVDAVEELIRDWRTTARALSNKKSRRTLTSPGEPLGAFKEVKRPEEPGQARKPRETSRAVRRGARS